MDDILKNKTVLSVISTDTYVEDENGHHKRIISALYTSTGLPYNYLSNEIGDLITHCYSKHYNDVCTLSTCFARLWANHCVDRDETWEDFTE